MDLCEERRPQRGDICRITSKERSHMMRDALRERVCSFQHGIQPHGRTGPDLMHSRCRGFGGSSFSVTDSVLLEHFVHFS